jgi:type I restriction enzyme S subunit
MNKQAKKGLVPELRFPEFRNRGEWDAATLGHKDIGDFVDEKVGRDELSLSSYMSTSNILPDFGGVEQAASLPPSGSFTRYRVGDILISNIRPYLKKIWLATFDGAASNDVIVVRPKKKVTPSFLAQLIINDAFVGYVMKNVQGLKMPRGEKTSMAAYPVVYPQPDEQQKIAACLSSLDALLAAEREKLEALRAHKKGLMQQLFPAEGMKVPELRFPGFGGEWEFRPLGDIGDVQMCKRIFAEETNESEGVPFYKIGTLGGIPDAYISRELFEKYKSKYNYPRFGEVLITCSGTVGKCLVYDGADAYYQDSNIVWIDNPKEHVINRLLYYLLERKDWKELSSTTITRIYGSDLRAVPVCFPRSKKEQEQVVGCLSSLDEIVEEQAKSIGALEDHKKGLMQGLFPGQGGMRDEVDNPTG